MANFNYNNIILKSNNKSEYQNQSAKLESNTRANYYAAIKYYAQKKLNFLKYITKKEEDLNDKVMQTLGEDIQIYLIKTWDDISKQILSFLDIQGYETGFKYEVKDIEKFNELALNPKLKERIIKGSLSGSGANRNIYSLLGFEYEQYLADTVSSIIQNQVNAGMVSLLGELEPTGSRVSKSAMRGEGLSIRPDLGIGIGDKMANNGVLYSKKGHGDLPVELQQEVNISELRTTSPTSFDILQQYADANMYGISVKTWAASPSGKKITDISGLKDKINTLYQTQYKKTISPLYATQIMNNEVSNYIFNILGMVNVAFITGKKILWTDEFLSNYLLTMPLGSRNKYTSKNGAIHPEIKENGVYAKSYKMSNAIKTQSAIISQAQYDNVRSNNTKPTHSIKFTTKRVKKST